MINKSTRIDASLLNYIPSKENLCSQLINENHRINSFECDNDSIIAASDHSFLVYNSQHLILYNIDGIIDKFPWNTNVNDSIKQIHYSSYHRAYLIMTARLISQFRLSTNYDILPLKTIEKTNEYFQLLTCHENDLWIVYLMNSKVKQILIHYEFHQWKRKYISLDKLSLYPTDRICAIDVDRQGKSLGLLIAERNQNLTVGIQRRRRLLIVSTRTHSPIREIYFSGADDLYWSLTFISYPKTGWLLTKCFDNELSYLHNNKLDTIQYKQSIRNLVITYDQHYLIIRTINSLDIYKIY